MSGGKNIVYFGAGPAKIPDEVLLEAQKQFLNYDNSGVSILEISHRSKHFADLLATTQNNIRELLNVPDNYTVVFVHGGATGQFAGVPLNLISKTGTADYFVTGSWSAKAAKEAAKYGKVNLVLPKGDQYVGVSDKSTWNLSPNASYVYYCDNETIHGVEFDSIPDTKGIPIVADMSSNFMSKPVDVSKFGIIFAGAQKNIGAAGVTLVIIRNDLIGNALPVCPTILDYAAVTKENTVVNTPPVYNIFLTGLVMQWIKKNGGIKGMCDLANKKSCAVYKAIDSSNGFYYCPVQVKNRSRMNIPFRVGGTNGNDDLEKKFLQEAEKKGLTALKGHRSVGGIRASIYNALTVPNVEKLATFMTEFYVQNKWRFCTSHHPF